MSNLISISFTKIGFQIFNNMNTSTQSANIQNDTLKPYTNEGPLYTLPVEIRKSIFNIVADGIISDLVQKTVFSNNDIKDAHLKLTISLSLVCKEFKEFSSNCKSQRINIKTIYALFNKYSAYNALYLTPGCGQKTVKAKSMVPCGNPQLLSLLSMGLNPALLRDFDPVTFTEQHEKDLKTIVELTPKSLHCNIGKLFSARVFITPFVMACFNTNIPPRIIEFLLEKGAEPNSIYSFLLQKQHLISDLKRVHTRYTEIQPILEKYGAKEQIFTAKDTYL